MAFCAIFVPDFLLQAVVRSKPALRSAPLGLLDVPAPVFSLTAPREPVRSLGRAWGFTKAAAAEFRGVQIELRNREKEAAAHAALLDAAWSISPRLEDTAIDLVTLDVDGLAALFGSLQEVCRQANSRCREMGLSVHVA